MVLLRCPCCGRSYSVQDYEHDAAQSCRQCGGLLVADRFWAILRPKAGEIIPVLPAVLAALAILIAVLGARCPSSAAPRPRPASVPVKGEPGERIPLER